MRSEKSLQRIAPLARRDEEQTSAERERVCEIVDPQAIADVLRELRALTPLARVRTSEGESIDARVRGVCDDSIGVVLDIESDVAAGTAQLHCELHGVLFVLHGQLRVTDGRVELCGPLRLHKSDRRVAWRQSLAEGRAELHWTSVDSERPSTGYSYVRDLTPRGAAIVPAAGSAPPPAGVFPAELRIGALRLPCLAETLHRPRHAGDSYGLHISAGRSDRELIDVYLRERLPRLRPRHEVDTKALRDLMVSSGYLSLRAAKANFAAWQMCQRPEDAFACDRVYVAKDGRLLGHASATRIYSRTWILHQLATVGGHAESAQCRAMLYAMVSSVPALYDGERASCMAYFDLGLRWHEVFFQGFLRWIGGASRLAQICAFDRFEREVPVEPYDAPAGYAVRVARDEDLIACSAMVRAQLPEITANAFDTHPGDLRRKPRRRGDRGREVLVLTRGDELAGVALCETGTPSLSLFNLVNMAQIYVRRGAGAPSREAQRALIAAARALYAQRSVDKPVVVAPAGTLDHDAEPGSRWAESMGCMVMTGRGVTQWENYCRFQFGRRWGRKSKQPGAKS